MKERKARKMLVSPRAAAGSFHQGQRDFHCLYPPNDLISTRITPTAWRETSVAGTTISHYKVIGTIGESGMGEVYRADGADPFD